MKDRVLISVPNTGWIHKLVVFSSIGLLQDKRFSSRLIMPTHSPYENNLHHILKDFIAGEFDFWLNIDSDNPPMKNPLDRVSDDLDLVGFPTPVFHNGDQKSGERPVYWNAYKFVPEKDGYHEYPVKSGLQIVDAIGTGCFLASKRLFSGSLDKAPFQRQYHEDGTVYKGNDISFCERVRACGYTIYADYDRPCRHYKELDLVETVQSFDLQYR